MMKAAMLTAPGRIEIREVPDKPLRADTDVRIRIDFGGICGSDLHYFRTGRIGEQVVAGPLVVGHECTGTVLETGKAVTAVRPGERVAVEPAVSCGRCDQCRTGRPNTCRRVQFMGCPGQLDGALVENIVMPETNCLPLPPELSSGTAVFSEPVSIALYAWRFLKGLDIRTVGILGAGPIGLAVLMAARERAGVRALVTDPLDARLSAAKALGADWTAGPQETDVPDAPEEFDAVFECCGREEAIARAARLLKPGGHLVIVGIPETEFFRIDLHGLRRDEITLYNVRRQNGCLEEAIGLCTRRRKEIDGLITHSFPLDAAQQAFDLAEGYRDGVIKSVIRMQG
ncbi:MAG TPA: hypothetical protein ENN17_08510 [bacterium]|nr:hypothetical protein [bacterium]